MVRLTLTFPVEVSVVVVRGQAAVMPVVTLIRYIALIRYGVAGLDRCGFIGGEKLRRSGVCRPPP